MTNAYGGDTNFTSHHLQSGSQGSLASNQKIRIGEKLLVRVTQFSWVIEPMLSKKIQIKRIFVTRVKR